jgi:uncharacterized protein (TIGR02678 family)
MAGSVEEIERRADRAAAIRLLLRHPMLDRDADDGFGHVVEYAAWLRRWFEDKCGWPLVVDARRGYARLRKIPAEPDEHRGALTMRSVPRPFTRRRYALFAVVAAVLGDVGRQQISLQDLAERVTQLTTDDPTLAAYDATVAAERVALVDVVMLLIRLGVLRMLDQAGAYEHDATANALYDIDDRRLAQLVAAPQPPSAVADADQLRHEDRYGPRPQPSGSGDGQPDPPAPTEEQRRLRARHMVMRRLLDDPVVHLADLGPDERQYLQATIAAVSSWLTEAGLHPERRLEGWAVIDESEQATDLVFPAAGSVVHQAALLLLDRLTIDGQGGWFARGRVVAELADLLARHPRWARTYQGGGGVPLLADRVVDLLAAMDLVRPERGGVSVLPAAARYRPHLVSTDDAATEASR